MTFVSDLLDMGAPTYGASKEGESVLADVFKADSDLETCKQLVNIFVKLNKMDVFRQAECVENKKLHYSNSVMEELFFALAGTDLSLESKNHLAEIIDTICICTSATGCVDAERLKTISRALQRSLAQELKVHQQEENKCYFQWQKGYVKTKQCPGSSQNRFNRLPCDFCQKEQLWHESH